MSVSQLYGIPEMLMLKRPLPESQRAALCTNINGVAKQENRTLLSSESVQDWISQTLWTRQQDEKNTIRKIL